ncbi:diphthine methyltransferase [Linepithema humile]|uniref:diphthine methyltransferase n=1 Tax=Linepithema humile TaxID=83485 RepID=UPI00351E2C66
MASKDYFHTLDTFITELSADSVEWCPAEPFKDVLACGTYKLPEINDSPNLRNRRIGQIYLFRVVKGGKLEMLHQIDTSGILDMKWMHITDIDNNRILLGVVNSNGYLQIYELRYVDSAHNKTEFKLIAEEKIGADDEKVMALSLDWSVGRGAWTSDSIPHIAVSDSLGRISHFTWHETSNLTKNFTWSAHQFQAWIVAFNYGSKNIFYSGGDDNKFLTFDTRVGSVPVFRSREHIYGVTSIHNNIVKPHTLVTGSYDQILRLWDTRNLNQPISKIDLEGGIWRLKWDPFKHQYLFAACMSEGFRIVNWSSEVLMSVCGHYDEHSGLSYGCDWSSLNKEDLKRLNISTGNTLISTCSYQDCALKLSVINFMTDDKVDDSTS